MSARGVASGARAHAMTIEDYEILKRALLRWCSRGKHWVAGIDMRKHAPRSCRACEAIRQRGLLQARKGRAA